MSIHGTRGRFEMPRTGQMRTPREHVADWKRL
jgi:hypothetical protein